jgi:two-component system response regulator YesN
MKDQYTVVLVDDEEQVRVRVSKIINQTDAFKVVGIASNGQDAFELIEEHTPDIVMTDISMPYIDGIELTKLIRRDYPKTTVVFLTGYDEFDYAKEAIELDVFKYLMKPLDKEDASTFLEDLEKRIDEERLAFYDKKRLDEAYQASKPLLVENQFRNLLQIEHLSEEVYEAFDIHDINLRKGRFSVCLFGLEASTDFRKTEKVRVFLLNLIPTLNKTYKQVFTFNTASGLAVVINHTSLNPAMLQSTLSEIKQRTDDYTDNAINIGVSDIFDDFLSFPRHFDKAANALSYSSYLNLGGIIFHSDISGKKTITLSLSREMETHMEQVIKFGDDAALQRLFDTVLIPKDDGSNSLLNQEYYLVNITSVIVRFAESLDLSIDALIEEDFLNTLFTKQSLKGALRYAKEAVIKLRNEKRQETKDSSKALMDKIQMFMSEHYADSDMQMEKLCEAFAISVSYLSALYKKHTDTTFSKNLINLRMNKAKELIKYSSLKVTEVANRVGYSDVYHFSHSFKKQTGVSPKEYRHV